MRNKILLFVLLYVFTISCVPQVFAASTLTYQYDGNGNLIQDDGKHYEYNDANRLVRVRHGSASGPVVAEYFYDHTGQRIKKIENGETTYYVGKHYETKTNGGVSGNAKYYFANGERVAKKDNSGNMYYYHHDHLGSTNVITDQSGNVVEMTNYYPFGEVREGGSDKYTYTGKEKDQATEFHYYEARFYNSSYFHFTQPDTIMPDLYDPQTLNRYAYVRNNPLKYIDPTGHTWWNPFTWFKKSSDQQGRVETKVSNDSNQYNSVDYRSYTAPKQTYLKQAPSQEPSQQAQDYVQIDANNQIGNFSRRGINNNTISTSDFQNSDLKVRGGVIKLADPDKITLGSMKVLAGTVSAAYGGSLIFAGCTTIAACAPAVMLGSPPLVMGLSGTLEGAGDVYSGFSGNESFYDNPLSVGGIKFP